MEFIGRVGRKKSGNWTHSSATVDYTLWVNLPHLLVISQVSRETIQSIPQTDPFLNKALAVI